MNVECIYIEAKARKGSLVAAQEKDGKLLNQLYSAEPPPHEQVSTPSLHVREACPFLLGPLIDASPSHPSWHSFEKLPLYANVLMGIGMKYIYLSPDIHLHVVDWQIMWNTVELFENIILRPGVMHIIQSVCAATKISPKGRE